MSVLSKFLSTNVKIHNVNVMFSLYSDYLEVSENEDSGFTDGLCETREINGS